MKLIPSILILGLVVCAALLSGCTNQPAQKDASGATTGIPTGTDELILLSEDYPPFNYVENKTPTGISVDLLLGAFRQMGAPISSDRIKILPWSEAYETALSSNHTVVFGTIRLPEREDLFKWAGPLGSVRKVIFSRRDNPPEIHSPADLNKYRIGVVKEDSAYTQLQEIGVNRSQIVEIDSVPGIISAMQEGTIDLWCYGEAAGRYFTGKVTGDSGLFKVVYTLDSRDIYYAFHKDIPDELVQSFQSALDTLRNQPDSTGVTEYQRIVYRYSGVSCKEQPTVTRDLAMGLVNLTAEAIERDASGTIARINAGEHPYWDRENRDLYTFVYDPNMTVVADGANPRMVGTNMRGKTDVAGTPFRDQIAEASQTKGTGWVDYIWMAPEESGVYRKSTYFQRVDGSDSRSYIVCSGMYIPCTSGN
jgi:polar amino acid transport system substrate-binding protein